MNPEQILERMRHDHGVSDHFAQRFLPLVRRATKTSPEIRHRILQLVERSFERQAARVPAPSPQALFSAADTAMIARVARILHRWEPAPWLQRWSGESA